MCLAQGHNAVRLVRLEHATPLSRVKHTALPHHPDLFLVINVIQKGSYGPPSRSNLTSGPIASPGRSVPVFQRKPITTCDFQGWVQTPCHPSGSAYEQYIVFLKYIMVSSCTVYKLKICLTT